MSFIDQFLQDHFEEFALDQYGLGKRWETLLLTPALLPPGTWWRWCFRRGKASPPWW
ncbi:hypothetical protein NG819_03645 [Pseudarthrobacter sp. Fe7]|nr:hypothetical protein NG819_03645 [Pseudarthrobacter sp. Fe7]